MHDELIVECPEEEKETVARLLTEEMEGAVHLSVPLTAEAHWGKNWLEAKCPEETNGTVKEKSPHCADDERIFE